MVQTTMRNITELNALSDDDLLHRLSRLAGHSRDVTADLVAHIGEVDRRRLFAREARTQPKSERGTEHVLEATVPTTATPILERS